MFRHVIAAMLLGISALPAAGQVPSRIEVVPLRSATLSGEKFLRGEGVGREVWLAGELRLPKNASARVPAVVLTHGSGGISGSLDLWARELNDIGVAAFILDSFSGRGITSTVEDQEQLNALAMVVDAYRALDMLAAHPRIRADRIAVIGFAKGAVAAVYSATDRFRRMHGSPDRRFAAHIGLGTPCYVAYAEDTKVGRAPIRLFHGIADDYVPLASCRDYAARLKEAGADVQLTEYPGAPHGFDNPLYPPLLNIPRAQTNRNCRLAEGPGGSIMDAATGEAYLIGTTSCVVLGAHVGHDPEAATAVRQAVRVFLTRTLLQ